MGVALRWQDTQRLDDDRRVRWSVVDGAMSAEPTSQPIAPTGDSKQTWPQGFLRSVQTFGNFEMTAEFWSEEDTNSGLFIRCAAPANPGSLGSCYEINISDPHATTPTGGIVGVHSPLPYRVKSAGKWSRFDVLADGPHLVVKVNSETLTDARDEKLREGAIGLQAGGPRDRGRSSFGTSGFARSNNTEDQPFPSPWRRDAETKPKNPSRSRQLGVDTRKQKRLSRTCTGSRCARYAAVRPPWRRRTTAPTRNSL